MERNQLGPSERGRVWRDCDGRIWEWDDSISEWNTTDGTGRFGGYVEDRYPPYIAVTT
jgi:hypothetical protein